MRNESDFLVLGSGIAGLLFALKAARRGTVTIVTKKRRADCNTARAQGGIAVVIGGEDSFDQHVADTLRVGCGLSRADAVRLVVDEAPSVIQRLETLGVAFTRMPGGGYSLGREGGHSQRRVAHVGDTTGDSIEEALLERVAAEGNIQVLEDHCAVDLIRRARIRSTSPDAVVGAYVLDGKTRKISPFASRIVFLATGGCGKVYQYTSNSDVASGDGIAMAYRAGCRVANLEFMQFHPTCLYHPEAKSFLVSETVRGEGAILTSISGERFLTDHPLKELAPRDFVARAIDREMKRRGEAFVHLHLEQLDAGKTRDRFPGIYESCLRYGIDITKQPIPVVPAAHYACGGVVVDLWGRTDLSGLYAAGEVTCSGVHGANRLASNSLLEASVFALRAAEDAASRIDSMPPVPRLPEWEVGAASLPKETVLINAHWDLVRRFMWDFVGIVRTNHRLDLASRYLGILRRSIESYYWDFVLDADLIELRNVALVAELIVRSARARTESRGLHFNEDHPRENSRLAFDTVLRSSESGGAE